MKYNTGKKEQILKFLSENSSRSYTLEEIVFAITHDGSGKSTIYRIVAELVESRALKRISDGKTRHCSYQYIGNDECKSHLHLKCRECGKLIHLDDSLSHQFADALLERGGFALEDGTMLFGKCISCNTPQKDECVIHSKNHVLHEHNHNADGGH